MRLELTAAQNGHGERDVNTHAYLGCAVAAVGLFQKLGMIGTIFIIKPVATIGSLLAITTGCLVVKTMRLLLTQRRANYCKWAAWFPLNLCLSLVRISLIFLCAVLRQRPLSFPCRSF